MSEPIVLLIAALYFVVPVAIIAISPIRFKMAAIVGCLLAATLMMLGGATEHIRDLGEMESIALDVIPSVIGGLMPILLLGLAVGAIFSIAAAILRKLVGQRTLRSQRVGEDSQSLRAMLEGCDYQFATYDLTTALSGRVIPEGLAALLDHLTDNPCFENAARLIEYDPKLVMFFQGTTESKTFRVVTATTSLRMGMKDNPVLAEKLEPFAVSIATGRGMDSSMSERVSVGDGTVLYGPIPITGEDNSLAGFAVAHVEGEKLIGNTYFNRLGQYQSESLKN